MSKVCLSASGYPILRNIELAVPACSHVAIVGASGAGKSSLVGLLLGWGEYTGNIQVAGRNLDRSQLAWLRRQTAWVDPAVQLWNQSLLANLRYGSSHFTQAALPEIIATADLQQILEGLPDGLHTTLGESGGLISGGEGQRVRLARALLRSPTNLVILDEPFRGLSRDQRHTLLKRAREVWFKATLLCITHDVAETLDFDQVVVLRQGSIVEQGPPAELAATSGSTYQTLLAHEQKLLNQVWGSNLWRRIRLQSGQLTPQLKNTSEKPEAS